MKHLTWWKKFGNSSIRFHVCMHLFSNPLPINEVMHMYITISVRAYVKESLQLHKMVSAVGWAYNGGLGQGWHDWINWLNQLDSIRFNSELKNYWKNKRKNQRELKWIYVSDALYTFVFVKIFKIAWNCRPGHKICSAVQTNNINT